MKNLSFFNNINKIYFIGIGGISMSALACIMKNHGFNISGSDIVKSEITQKLEKENIKVIYNQQAKNIKKFQPDLVVYSGAIKEENKELKYARIQNIYCLERNKFIKELLSFYKNVISISGTHGKSTTTSMISEIFFNAKLNPTVHIGAESVNLNSNFLVGKNNFFINEACEYKKSFLDFKSTLGVILNIEEDHPDCYKNLDEIKIAFNNFASICNNIVINSDYENYIINNNKLTFNFKNALFSVRKIKNLSNGGYSFIVFKNNVFYEKFILNIFGKHNILNALASICVADFFNIDKNIIKSSLYNFKGLKRRFEQFDSKKLEGKIYFDYAHHPTEIKKLLEEVKIFNKPVICVFQPHTYSRTKKYFDDFLQSFKNTYQTIFYKTYHAREKKIKGGQSKDIYNKLKKNYNVYYYNSFSKIIKHLKKYAKINCIVLFVGAGDIYNIKQYL
ncbi:MAG: UDP-N-acetylmuramate--L-alanine ligase [Clostridiales bacterium]|nr:UDP-N-acetylmuramate--L-alanine ligase [Clostridiales bacterium]